LLFIWWGTILAGRLMAYHDIANVERQTIFAVLTATIVMLFAGFVGFRLWILGKPLWQQVGQHAAVSEVKGR
jgi:hypothetical protein